MEDKIKNILLTGSNGFVGQEIAKCIADEGHIIGLGRKSENQCPYVDEYVSADLWRQDAPDSFTFLPYRLWEHQNRMKQE